MSSAEDSPRFATPQAAEDTFYDALDERDPALMRRVWDDSADIALLLPLQPLVYGGEVHQALADLLRSDVPLDLQVSHLHWVEIGDLAIHYVQERNMAAGPSGPASDRIPALYATNIYRRRADGDWRMILHQNAPPPPPAMSPGP
ncbi:nuclear transport factor 2 family protein [Thiohalocapsa marina]|uniref:Nuclear transport factor 2 family protein n=1 Tax=Thiohalocapsa marina TaxID=424902 RepID=A0A5M8FID3_9GAMM|nr:nuclear transport factor 2 family protein [Thiohalocapsa marina]KAA6184683.1 nuclear transport factor 2 family protein [Thiohalocapsa marina]